MVTLGSCLRKDYPDFLKVSIVEPSPCTLQPALSDLHCPWEAQATVEGPPLDIDQHSNSLLKPPRGNKHEALQRYIS